MSEGRELLARALTPLARRVPFSPNAITALALLLCLTAACLLAAARFDARLFLLAPAIALLGGLLDALDGIVARVRNQSSRFGDFFDHFADRVADSALLAGWMWGSGVRSSIAMIAIIMVLLVGYSGTQIEATFGTRSYEDVGRAQFIAAIVLLPVLSYLSARAIVSGAAGLSAPEIGAIMLIVVTVHALLQRLRRAGAIARELDR